MLIASSLVTTLLIPAEEFAKGGDANGRALAYLAHEYLGRAVRHGLRREHDPHPLVRRRLGDGRPAEPRARATCRATAWRRNGAGPRPLVLVFTAIAFVVTVIFEADVDAQGGAYATGVLVLMMSAAVAVTLVARMAGAAADAGSSC